MKSRLFRLPATLFLAGAAALLLTVSSCATSKKYGCPGGLGSVNGPATHKVG